MTICKPWVYRSVNAFVFPSGRPWLGRMAVGCDLGLLTPWDRVFEFRLGSDVPYCLFRVACDMRVNRDDLTLHPAAPITHYVTERKLTFFFLFFFFPLPLLLNIKVSSCCFIPAFQSVSLPPSLPLLTLLTRTVPYHPLYYTLTHSYFNSRLTTVVILLN